MASPKTIELKRNNVLRRLLSVKVHESPVTGPSRAERRRNLQAWCREFDVPYEKARAMIKEEEAAMRAKGIDPWAQKPEPKNEAQVIGEPSINNAKKLL